MFNATKQENNHPNFQGGNLGPVYEHEKNADHYLFITTGDYIIKINQSKA